MKKLYASVCAITHSGRVRKENEDNYSLNGKMTGTGDLKKGSAYVQNKIVEPFHLAVCDGMGGESYGDVASDIAVREFVNSAKSVYESGEDFSFAISNFLDAANSKICSEINARGKRMGTTLSGIYAVKGKVICVSIGDTRIYRYTNGILEQMSFDHTHGQGVVDAGGVASENAMDILDAKRLTRHLGVFPEEAVLSPSISVIDDIQTGDILLLCSDGLTDMLTDTEITSIIAGGENAQDTSGKLLRKAMEKGGKDNITVITAYMTAEDTAIFAPIAEAMVGKQEVNYEEEYRHSYGPNVADDDVDNSSPYANADANAYKKPVDKKKILKIAGLAAAVLAVLAIAAFVIKMAIDRKNEIETTVPPTTEADTGFSIIETTTELSTWEITETTEEESESTTEAVTTRSYTKPYTKAPSTTKKPTTTKAPASTSQAPSTTTPPVSDPTTTQPVTDPVTTSPTTPPATDPVTTSPTTPPTTSPTTPPTTTAADNPAA